MKKFLFFSFLISGILLLGSCTPKLVSTSGDGAVDDIVISEVLVKLKENVTPQTLESAFSKYNLRVDPLKANNKKAANTHIFRFNDKKIEITELLLELVKHPGVAEANFVEVTEFD